MLESAWLPGWTAGAVVWGGLALWFWSKSMRECSPKRVCAYHRRVRYGWPTPGWPECRGWAVKKDKLPS